jgi:hypothetical protein
MVRSHPWCNLWGRKDTARDAPGNCFDLGQCAAAAATTLHGKEKYAIVLTNTLQQTATSHRFRPEALWSFTAWQKLGIDTVLLVPECKQTEPVQLGSKIEATFCDTPEHGV